MAKLKLVINNKVQNIKVDTGTKLSTVLQNTDLSANFFCGGKGACGKCKAKVIGYVSSLSVNELSLLSLEEINNNIRLACQVKILGDCSCFVHTKSTTIFATNDNKRISLDLNLETSKAQKLCAAVDLGTTTICIKLSSLDGSIISETSDINPTCSFGADVITRIDNAVYGNLDIMGNMLIKKLNQMFYNLLSKSQTLDNLVITGNTTMLSLLTRTSCDTLSKYPFRPASLFGVTVSNKTLGLLTSQTFDIYLPKCISAFVGADASTCFFYTSYLNTNIKNYIIIDIGTNGEIILNANNRLICCSTAMGPAFEGANIKFGMRATSGAVSKVYFENNQLKFTTINNSAPIGICGSGLIDLISVLLKINVIDETGLLAKSNCTVQFNGQNAFKLPGCDICLTQEDIRNVQLAKAALCAGIKTLLLNSRLPASNLQKVFIAGNFGNFINIDNAICIGLFPAEFKNKCEFLGNAALNGAMELALTSSNDLIQKFNKSINEFQVLDLSNNDDFRDLFVDCLSFI